MTWILWKGAFLFLNLVRYFLKGASSLGSFLFFYMTFLGSLGVLHVNVLGSASRESIELRNKILTRDLKKSPSRNPCEKGWPSLLV